MTGYSELANPSESIRQLAKELVSTSADPSEPPIGLRVAQALLWEENGARLEQVERGLPAPATRAYLGNEPAMVFLGSDAADLSGLLHPAANLAYHSSIDWGLVANTEELIVFSSRWMLNESWLTLPAMSWAQLSGEESLASALTPSGIVEGLIDEIALDEAEAAHSVLSVDEALVERLDHWRDEALKHSHTTANVDTDLQTAFAQLFVLRSIEDRGLAPSIPSLSSCLGNESQIDKALLGKAFNKAAEMIQAELFNDLALLQFPEFILAGIVQDLYTPRHLPAQNLRYDFSWIQADVLGKAYEKYLSNILVPAEIEKGQISLWRQPKRGAKRVTVQKRSGIYYTPAFLVSYITERALEEWSRSPSAKSSALPRVADFSCGSGSFLVAAVDAILRKAESAEQKSKWITELVDERKIIGIDNDPRAVMLARLALWLRIAEEPDPLPLPRLEKNIVCADSLSDEVWGNIPTMFDIVVGNPPFIATGRIISTTALRERFEVAEGRYDFSYLFLELAIRHLRDRGVLGMVVPNRLFINRNADKVRKLLAGSTEVSSIVDFGGAQIFEGVQAYIGVIVASKREDAEAASQKTRVIKVKSLPARSAAAQVYAADKADGKYSWDGIRAFDSTIPEGENAWLLLSEDARKARIQLEGDSTSLSSVAEVNQGIKTGANDVFIVRVVGSSDSPIVEIENGLGDSGLLERSLLHPVVYGSDIRRYRLATVESYILYPYHNGSLIDETDLDRQFPRTYQYLMDYRSILSSRKTVDTAGLQWYELAWKRDRSWLEKPKLLVRDLATRPAFAPDQLGELYIVGGTAVVPADPAILLPLLAFLNSAVTDWYLRASSAEFGSGFQKFEPRHLKRIPIPDALINEPTTSDRASSLVGELIAASARGDRERAEALELELDEFVIGVAGVQIQDII